MTAILDRFRVQHFRSVNDSGWVDTNELTALIGTNEAGKTNLLLPLWKLKPANKEPIEPLVDYPRQNYSSFKANGDDTPFIMADFTLDIWQAKQLADELKINPRIVQKIRFQRYWDGKYHAILLDTIKLLDNVTLVEFFKIAENQVDELEDFEEKETISNLLKTVIKETAKWKSNDFHSKIEEAISELKNIDSLSGVADNVINNIILRFQRLVDVISADGHLHDQLFEIAFTFLPSFVYYSDYGNLNSEIYLPRVMEDLKRTDLKGLERDKARTLKVLFDFVSLSPTEILELGQEQSEAKTKSQETINEEKKNKQEREVLLQSASIDMTKKFREWWKQGDYKFRFQADGNHFRIWVSDDRRQEEIELESRSRGLQWFFSFFLVFLVESNDEHASCILLLDEPGVTLHPSAQEDLIAFFMSLSKNNQVIYTTHSPFLIDSSNLGKVKAVYVDDEGYSTVSTDLRRGNKIAEKSVYPAHAAIGLTVSETFLNGCQPVLVEGVSDQIYLHAIKIYLIKKGLIKPNKEIVFIPTGGVKGMKPIISIISSKDASLPVVVLDSDESGVKMCTNLKTDLYSSDAKKIIEISSFVSVENCEIEDLFPTTLLAENFDRKHRTEEDTLEERIDGKSTFLTQAEKYIDKHSILVTNGWKVDLAKNVVSRLHKKEVDPSIEKVWKKLFDTIIKTAG